MTFEQSKTKKLTSKKGPNRVTIGGVNLSSSSQKRLLMAVGQRLKSGQKTFVVTPNPEFIVFAQKTLWFKRILNSADLVIPDGMGLIWASKLLSKNRRIKERVTGVDFMEALCEKAAQEKRTVYLLGGRPGVAQKTLAVLKRRYPKLKGWANSGPKIKLEGGRLEMPANERRRLLNDINQKKPDLFFVALGMGKQEKFIKDNWNQLPVKLAMGIGGAFNYLSGKARRAPVWAQKVGLEWLFRLVREPWRWRRQLRLLEFIKIVLREKLKKASK